MRPGFAKDPNRAFLFTLALDLGVDHRVIEAWPAGVLADWEAFYSWRHKMQQKARKDAEREAKRKR